MALSWHTVEDEAIGFLHADVFEINGKWNTHWLDWANRLIREIAQEIEIRDHLVTCTRAITTSDTSVLLPDIFFKISERFTKVRISGTQDEEYIDIVGLDVLREFDPDRSETRTSGVPDAVAIEGGRLYTYPLFTGTIYLEDYLREPTALEDRTGNVDLPYDETLHDLLLYGVSKKAWIWLQDFDMASFCRSEYGRLLDLYKLHVEESNTKEVNTNTYY